jgi:DNA-binding ferritin-like protein
MQARDNNVIWTGGGEPPGGPQMEARIGKLEALADKIAERLGTLERDVAVIKSNYATRSDIADAKNSIVMWVVSVILLAQVLPGVLKRIGM